MLHTPKQAFPSPVPGSSPSQYQHNSQSDPSPVPVFPSLAPGTPQLGPKTFPSPILAQFPARSWAGRHRDHSLLLFSLEKKAGKRAGVGPGAVRLIQSGNSAVVVDFPSGIPQEGWGPPQAFTRIIFSYSQDKGNFLGISGCFPQY